MPLFAYGFSSDFGLTFGVHLSIRSACGALSPLALDPPRSQGSGDVGVRMTLGLFRLPPSASGPGGALGFSGV